MKINSNQWIKTLTLSKKDYEDEHNSNPEKWIHTLPKEKKHQARGNARTINWKKEAGRV